VGETGLGYAGSITDRLTWFESIVGAKTSLKYLISVSWFNYIKEWDYKICSPTNATVTNAYIDVLTSC